MISAWENRHLHKARLNGRLYRVKLRVNRWWIYHVGSGDPERNPFLLTSKLKNVPLISLRNDEYIDFLSKQHFVGKKWEDYWEKPIPPQKQARVSTKHNRNKYRNKTKKVNIKKHGTPNFKIFEDQEANKENLIHTVINDQSNRNHCSKRFQVINYDDLCSLDSFEKDLIASASSLSGDGRNSMLWGEEMPTSSNHTIESTSLKIHPILNKMNAENDGFKNRISIIGDLNNVINLTMNNVSFRENRSLTKSTIKNKSNFQSSTKISHFHINNVYDTVKKRTQVFGVRGWIANNVRPLTKRTIRNILAPKDHSSTFQPSTIPLIQQADFFKRNDMQSREKGFGNSRNHHSHHSIARYHQYQIKENIRLNGSIQKKKLKSLGGNNLKESLVVRYRRPGLGTSLAFDSLQSKITNADGIVTRSDLLGTIGRNRAIESLITQISLKQKKNSLDNNLSQKETVLTEPKKPESRWRIFSGLRQHRLALKKARITESRTSNVKTEKEDVHEGVPKITSLQLSVATENQVEFGEIATQYREQERSASYPSIDDVYDIFASYEELHT